MNEKITLDQDRTNQFNRRNELKAQMIKTTSIHEYCLAAAELNALEARKEIQKLKDILRKHPDSKTEQALLQIVKNQLAMYEVDIAEMREYGKANFS